MAGAGEAQATEETPAMRNPQNLLGVFELLNVLGGGQLGGDGGAAVAGAGGAPNPADTPQVESVGQVVQASQNLQNLATPEQATTSVADTSATTKAREELQGVPAATEKVIKRSTAACVKNEFKWQWAVGRRV
jgi:hypothetical protein